jgi:hypothetical protein
LTLFEDYDVRMDPLQIEYGSELPLEPVAAAIVEGVDTDTEVPESQWSPIRGSDHARLRSLAFVDGVRRLEARLLLGRGKKRPCHGAFGRFAVGVVSIRGSTAEIVDAGVHHSVVLASAELLPSPVEVMRGLVYDPASTPKDDADEPLQEEWWESSRTLPILRPGCRRAFV